MQRLGIKQHEKEASVFDFFKKRSWGCLGKV